MFNHAPTNYDNPFAKIVAGEAFDTIPTNREDVFYQDSDITAFLCSRSWMGVIGNILIIPNDHYENLYDMPDDLLGKISIFSKKVAIALKKTYGCDGVTIRQHNEPAGGQEVWHYHVHVIPRYADDGMHIWRQGFDDTTNEERAQYGEKLRDYFRNTV